LLREGVFLQSYLAQMQTLKWNDLRYILAIGRGRTLASAARLLGVDDTTVARRLAAVQATIGTRLYERTTDGTLQLTSSGKRAALIAERIEREINVLSRELSGASDIISGTVRVTSVPIVVNRILVPSADMLLKRHPKLRLEIIGDAKNLSLTRREADLALRLARPKTGGTKIMARRVGRLRYAAYAAASSAPREQAELPWITYDETMAHLPQARWITAYAVRNGDDIAAIRVTDAETLLEAVASGIGRSLLPCFVADRDARLRRLNTGRRIPLLTRELWLLAHSDLRRLRRIQAVIEWIERIAPR
jgi:DNA-binding transcriptional LysR family regulator